MNAIQKVFTLGLLVLTMFTMTQAMNVEITNVNVDNFPGIHVFVRVTDDQGNIIEDLSSYNFEIRENGVLIDDWVSPQFGYMAVTLVMDESGSMSEYEQQVIDACNYFVNGLENLDKGAIVKFANTAAVDVPMTYDKDELLASIATYQTSGTTDLYDAIYLGIEECFYEPEKKAVVAFTDGNNNQPGVYAAQLPGFAGTDIAIYTIGIGSITPDSLIYISEATGGFYLPIDDPSQMQEVLEDIRFDVNNLYDCFYNTPDPSTNGSERQIEVVVNYLGEIEWDVATYNAPNYPPPAITLSDETAALLGISQNPNFSLHLSCEVESETTISDARIYYRTMGATYYEQADLIHGAGNFYYYDIPASTVAAPGIEFYFQVTDARGATSTLPGYSPGSLPLAIPVQPNLAPSFSYIEPTIWLDRQTLPIELAVYDDTIVDSVKLYYKDADSYFYNEVMMTQVNDTSFQAEILGTEVNQRLNLTLFFAAWDDQGSVGYWASSYNPWYIDVVIELGPTDPAVALDPESSSIVIPSHGGSFFYTMNVINPINDYGYCDAWADMIRPDGAIQEIGLLGEDIVTPPGGIFEQAFIQEVPDTAAAGDYTFRVHTGEYMTHWQYYMDSFTFTKSGVSEGGPYTQWYWEPITSPPSEGTGGTQIFFAYQVPTLGEGYPNPFNATTSLQFYLPEDSYVNLVIFNLSGQEVQRLGEGYYAAGSYRVNWNAQHAPSGIYFANLITRHGVLTTKLTLIK
ncbi:VWA domain-containing protein [bacterium]|nr:VWA domain-containing protein [bacterium]